MITIDNADGVEPIHGVTTPIGIIMIGIMDIHHIQTCTNIIMGTITLGDVVAIIMATIIIMGTIITIITGTTIMEIIMDIITTIQIQKEPIMVAGNRDLQILPEMDLSDLNLIPQIEIMKPSTILRILD